MIGKALIMPLAVVMTFSLNVYAENVVNPGLDAANKAGAAETGFFAKASEKCGGWNVIWCTMMAMSAVQMVQNFGAADSANQAYNSLDSGAGDFSVPGPGGISEQQRDQYLADAQEALKNAKKMGIEIDPKKGTIKTPKGEGSLSAAASGEAMADAGLIGEEDIAAYNDALKERKKIKDKFVMKSLGSAKGGYSPSKRRTASEDDSFRFNFGGVDKSKIKPAQTSGLTKDFGGDPIGVASDDLFQMLSQRYDSLKEENQFIKNSDGSYADQ